MGTSPSGQVGHSAHFPFPLGRRLKLSHFELAGTFRRRVIRAAVRAFYLKIVSELFNGKEIPLRGRQYG